MDIHRLFGFIFRLTRPRRMRHFATLLSPTDETLILDVGGLPYNWQYLLASPPVVLLNMERPPEVGRYPPRFRFLEGDGCALPFVDRSIPIVFSNSVIEHVGDWDAQQAFARELRRAGSKVWIQTPARIFPIEPHFIAPFVHWLPVSWRKKVVRYASVWGWLSRRTQEEADRMVDGIRLLSHSEMVQLFPDCEILVERFLFWPKAYIAVRR